MYIKNLHGSKWNSMQAPTQYQGEGSSHDLAALLVTEVIQHSLYVSKDPLFVIFLDARSAFDKVIFEYLIRNIYLSGVEGNSLLYINHRLANRCTYVDWDRTLMGPIKDQQGVEQGGPNSSDYYKLYNNELLETPQKSELGVKLGRRNIISSVGLADDTGLVSNTISNLRYILHLAISYCKKYQVTLCPEKTKLLMFGTTNQKENIFYNPIKINNTPIEFTDQAEHVGIVRSVHGNLPHLVRRFVAHKNSLASVLSCGAARGHRANPMAAIKVESVYATPVLMSGLASLVLSSPEITLVDQHYKDTLQNLQKLHQNTPRSVTFFLAGCLPAQAILHMNQLSLFGMITRLREDPLNLHARNVLTSFKSSSRSWFFQVRDLCIKYMLPHPLVLLESPPSKPFFKKLVKSHIIDYWEQVLRSEASILPSIPFFKPEYMSLVEPHPIWKTAGSNPYEVSKAIQQARFLSGRYRTESLCRHWSANKKGLCLSLTCENEEESVHHILITCCAYHQVRDRHLSIWHNHPDPIIRKLLLDAAHNPQTLLQFLLDCSVLPNVILAAQEHGSVVFTSLFKLTRTYCYAVHRERLKLLGRWNQI